MTGEDEYIVRNNPAEFRYELLRDGELRGFIQYYSDESEIGLVHTEVDASLEGQGLGSRLISGALDDIRARGLRVRPLCPFVVAYLRRHPEQSDLVVGRGERER